MENQNRKLRDIYGHEINEIKQLLHQLESRRIYLPGTFTNSQNDGTLEYNIVKLRKQLNDLFNKIEDNKPSEIDKLDEIF